MWTARMLTGPLVSLAVIGMCMPPIAMAATSSPQPSVTDVALLDGGMLIGQVVDSQGTAVADVPVVLRHQNRDVTMPKTDAKGYFAVKGLRAGVYQMAANQGRGTYRLWAPGTAPPTAQRGALIVNNGQVARAQYGGGGLKAMFANPWIVAGVVATAVAVPVAVHNSSQSTPVSP